MKYILPAMIACALFGGCTVTPIKISAPFIEAEYQPFIGNGSSTITGSAFMKTLGGDVKLAAGNQIELTPATAYTRERIDRRSQVGLFQQLESSDPRLAQYVRTTIADAQGYFEFKNIPSGDYILSCSIDWQYYNGKEMAFAGGRPVVYVTVARDETKKVILTK